MKVEYIHASAPNETRVFDTSRSLKNNSFIRMTAEEYDAFELNNFEKGKAKGEILSYHVLEEDPSQSIDSSIKEDSDLDEPSID